MAQRWKGGGGGGVALEAIWLLTQEADTGVITLVDARNGFNVMIRLEMLWTVHHHWQAGAMFAFNCYMHWSQLLLCQPGDALVIILSLEGVIQGDPISMLLYGITLVPLEEDLKDMDLTVMSHFCADDAAFDGLTRRSVAQLKMLMDRGPDRGYFT